MSQLIGPGPIAAGGATSIVFATPFPHKPGEHARDNDGNEYVFVDFTANVYYGCLVQIDSTHLAAPLLGTASRPYRVGVVCSGTPSSVAGDHPTSDNGGWVQIYGVHSAVQTGIATDGAVSATAGGAYFCIPQTSVGTPSGTLSLIIQAVASSIINTSTSGNIINGMWLVDFAETSNLVTYPGTSATSGPVSRDILNDTSGANTSAFIGQTHAVFLNYPWVTGISVPLMDATSDS